MISNVVELLNHAQHMSDRTSKLALLLFDFCSAFPSLARKFIFRVLEASKLPPNIINAIRELYKDNDHYYAFGGIYKFVFTVFSGVRQGCPLSSAIFAIVTDPLILYIKAHLSKEAFFRAYCDDYALALKQVWRDLPTLAVVFSRIAKASALVLNLPKCKLLPLWEFSPSQAARTLKDVCPAWQHLSIDYKAMYLGFLIGLHAHLHAWDKPLAKYIDRINLIRISKAGFSGAIFLHNVCAITVFSHVAQLYEPPIAVITAVNNQLKRLIPAPGNWITPVLMCRIKLLLPFLSQPYDFATWTLAVRIRVLFCTLRTWTFKFPEPILSVIPVATGLFFPHATLRRTFDKLVLDNFVLPCGNFSDRGFNSRVSSLDAHSSVQSLAYEVLFSRSYPREFYQAVYEKLIKWRLSTPIFKQRPLVEPLVDDALRAGNVFSALRLPARVLNAILLTWFQGWVTEERVNQRRVSCHICGAFFTTDSVLHFAHCRPVRLLSERHLGLYKYGVSNHKQFLCLADEPPHVLRKRAIHLYIFKKSYDYCRVNNILYFDSLCHCYRNNLLQFCGLFPFLQDHDFLYNVLTEDDVEVDLMFD